MFRIYDQVYLPSVEYSGFEPQLSEEERAVQGTVHKLAKEAIRPLGRALDRMTAEQVVAPGSPYWDFFAQAGQLGLGPEELSGLDPVAAMRLEALIAEELGWGDAGLAVSLGAGSIALIAALSSGNQELIEMVRGRIGCWIITQPDRGSDATRLYADQCIAGDKGNKGNLTAKVTADEIIINGQCSAWVSNGASAQVALMYIAADYGKGFFPDGPMPTGIGVIVPLDRPGVTRGKPLEKIGQRALPQGEIFFDNVKVPRRFAVAEGDGFYPGFAASWSFAGTFMGNVFGGVARAAFEMALAYAHERKQGGALLAEHQLVQYRLGEMARTVELIRSVARRTAEFARLAKHSHPFVTAQGKVTCTNEAFRVVNEAFQMFGGNGTTLEYPIEKLLRDTRVALIEDGDNYVLTTHLGNLVCRLYREGWTRD